MKKLYLLTAAAFIAIVGLLSFKNYDKSPVIAKQELRGLEIRSRIPLQNLDTVGYAEFTSRYYQKDSIIVFVHPVEKYHTERDPFSNDGTNDRIIKIGETNRYFVYWVNAARGIRYDSLSVQQGTVFSVDSLLKSETVTNLDSFCIPVMANDSLLEGRWSEDRQRYVEKYICREKKDETYSDSTILIYSPGLDKYFFSFSPYLEKAKGIKLRSFKLIYNGTPGAAIKSYRIPRQVLMEINELPEIADPDVAKIFSRFQKEKTR